MTRRPRRTARPLPQRDGIDAVRVPMTTGRSVADNLRQRFPTAWTVIEPLLDAGNIVDDDGKPVAAQQFLSQGTAVHFYRQLPDEEPVPFEVTVRYRDENILVVDKPHFLATTPRGAHIRHTALARLRVDLDLPQLSPAHRLDRLTAGLLLFTVTAPVRRAYQDLFAARSVHKEYRAIAAAPHGLAFPVQRSSRIIKHRSQFAAVEEPGEPNAHTRIELEELLDDGYARYRLIPLTGRTHQLRVHMSALGLPILGDPFYAAQPTGYSNPLRLLAHTMRFTDPVTGAEREFTTSLDLAPPGSMDTST